MLSILSTVYNFLFTDIRTTIISIIIGYVVYKLAKLYNLVYSLPPGPLPVPILGNIHYFRGTKEHWSVELKKLAKKYGPLFTFWLGPDPYLFICDIDLGREAFRKNDMAGRPDTFLTQMLSTENLDDIPFADYGHQWEAMRRVAHSAAQKYSTTDRLVYLVSDCVDQTMSLIVEKEGFDNPFVPNDYIYYTFQNIGASSAFGTGYDINDTEYKLFKYYLQDIIHENKRTFELIQFLPVMRSLRRDFVNKYKSLFKEVVHKIRDKYQSHYKDYNESIVRDFCDTLITAKNEAIRVGKESAPYLTDDNLSMCVLDLFLVGTDTSQITFKWILLLITYYPNVQKKLRQEIESEIGDRIATHEDRSRCHYVMAVLSETLRLRNVAPAGLFHSAVVDTKIGEYPIAKGTGVFLFQGYIMNDEKHWSDPDQFIPERFLENGKYITSRSSAFIPFGVGRRVCLGEKLAIAHLFLVLVRFLQKTSEYDLDLHSNSGIDPDPNIFEAVNPKNYEIILKKKF